MRHILKNRFTLFLLAAVLALNCFALAGCNNNPDGGAGGNVVRPADDTNDFKMNNNVNANVALTYDANWYAGSGFTKDNNPVYDLHKSAINVTLKNNWALPWDGYEQQVQNSLILPDTMPDMFFVNQLMLDSFIKSKLIVDMKPYYEQWATDDLKEVIGVNDGINLAYPTRDGKIYAIPAVIDEGERPVLWFRLDWVKKLNQKMTDASKFYDKTANKMFHEAGPKSIDEFWALAEAFALNDPDSNGKKDTFGLSMSQNFDYTSLPIYNAYGAYPTIMEKDDSNNFKNLALDDAMAEPLTMLRDMVGKNVIDSDYKTWSAEEASAKLKDGQAGMMFGVFYTPLNGLKNTMTQFGAEWGSCPMITKDGTAFEPTRTANSNGYYVVRRGFSNPEVLIKILNNIASQDSSNEWQKGYADISKLPKTDNIINWLPVKCDRYDANHLRYDAYKFAANNKVDGTYDKSKIKISDIASWNKIEAYLNGDGAEWAWHATYFQGVEVSDSYAARGKFNDWNYPQTKTLASSGTSLDKLFRTTIAKIIARESGYEDVSKAWTNFREQWYNAGGRKIISEMKTYYNSLGV